jgi:hypothetical protein
MGSKACFDPDWQKSNLPSDTLKRWIADGVGYGVGLLMGSPIRDGTRLGAIDVDHDDYIRVIKALLGEPVSGRIGSKGLVTFVRVRGIIGNPEFRVPLAPDQKPYKVAECLFDRKLCVIPPTIHPDTGRPYRWIGTPLHELDDLTKLPLIEGTERE